ncbi:hypothetical protein [Tychonema sp. LEGE 07203]|uniref:hypothetical protein n=1 Tax=Tychonema sp. LEGE 07203 TaxID=1828671 RepID=UPI00188013CF|nr:hypothetical protein [Tychonema sp. LEGE 07203]MBE9095225.1 hypothetical protein [Tychonema sp. LEGE 07203]
MCVIFALGVKVYHTIVQQRQFLYVWQLVRSRFATTISSNLQQIPLRSIAPTTRKYARALAKPVR